MNNIQHSEDEDDQNEQKGKKESFERTNVRKNRREVGTT
jgi:hypothetical protein